MMEYFLKSLLLNSFQKTLSACTYNMALNTHQHMLFSFQLVDKLTTDEDIQDVEFDLNDVSD